MPQRLISPAVADRAPVDETITAYDRAHLITYLRLLDAAADDADWCEVARIVLQLDPVKEPERAHASFCSHLERAKWMTRSGYRHLLDDCRE